VADFNEELQALIERSANQMIGPSNISSTMPVVADYLLVVALDDAADVEGGGLYLNSRPNTPLYRTIGLLTEGQRMLFMRMGGGPND
jgi:hypothetical protein